MFNIIISIISLVLWIYLFIDAKKSSLIHEKKTAIILFPIILSNIIFFFTALITIFQMKSAADAVIKLILIFFISNIAAISLYFGTKKTLNFKLFDYYSSQLKFFLNSFKTLNKKLLLVIVLDVLFVLFLLFALNSWNSVTISLSNQIDISDTDLLNLQDSSLMGSQISQLESFIFKVIWLTVFLALLVVFMWSLFQGVIWLLLLKLKIKLNKIFKFFLLNIIWIIIWILPFVLPLLLISGYAQRTYEEVSIILFFVFFIFMIVLLSFIHFSILLATVFFREEKIFASIGKAFKNGLLLFHKFLLPYSFIFLIMTLLNVLNFWASAFQMQNIIYLILNSIILLCFLAWMRHYYLIALNDILPEKLIKQKQILQKKPAQSVKTKKKSSKKKKKA